MSREANPTVRPRPRRAILRVGLLLATLAVGIWFGGSAFVAYKLTRRPHPPFPEPTPDLDWGKAESHRLTTADGEQIGAWYVRGLDSGPSVVLLHGNGGQRQDCLSRGKLLAQRGCSVLLISARAHGDSSGDYNDFGYGARNDVIAAVEFLEQRRPGRPILLQGMSLGAAASTFAARELGDRVHGCFLELPFRDLRTATYNRTRVWMPPVFSDIAYVGLITTGQLFVPHLDRVSPLEAISDIPSSVPVWVLAGGQDEMARPAEAEALFQPVKDHGRLTLFPEARHESLLRHDPQRYTAALDEWLTRVQKRQ